MADETSKMMDKINEKNEDKKGPMIYNNKDIDKGKK